jgi:hypothetical protein
MKNVSISFILIAASLTLAIVLLSFGCSSDKKTNTEKEANKTIVQHIKLPQSGEDILSASTFADTVIYIPLETTKESLIQGIKDLWISDSIILVSCWKNGLMMFSRDGKFIRRIGKQGKGPGEYLSIFSFDVVRDTIYVSSTGRAGFLRYTLDGNFCDEIKLSYQPVYFSTTADGKLVCYFQTGGKILVYNKAFNNPDTITVEYNVTQGRHYYTIMSATLAYLQKTSSGLLFNSYLNDTTWNISGTKKEPAYIFDLKDKLPYDKQVEFSNGDFQRWHDAIKQYHYVHPIPFPAWTLIFQLNWSTTECDAIYLNNNKTNEIRKYNTSYIYDDIAGKLKLSYINYIYNRDYLVALTDPDDVFEAQEENKTEGVKPSTAYSNQLKKIKEDDNPILVLMKVKKE